MFLHRPDLTKKAAETIVQRFAEAEATELAIDPTLDP
jgi:hypothetical protein